MQEISLNILDIAQNSIKAGAKVVSIEIFISEEKKEMAVTISDDGSGIPPSKVKKITNPFYTTRTTRKVGLGIPLFKMNAELTGGSFEVSSTPGIGTKVCALFKTDSVNMLPLGDIASTMVSLIQLNPELDFSLSMSTGKKSFNIHTKKYKAVLEDVPINSPEVLSFIKDDINEGLKSIY